MAATRTITVYSTKGQRMVKIESSASTWGELKVDFKANNIDFADMQVVCNENKAILKLDGAVLPVNSGENGGLANTTIFLSATKMKAGYSVDTQSFSYAECKNQIKELRNKSEEAKEFFGDYTHDSTDTLRDSLQEWYNNNPTKKVAKKREVEVQEETVSNRELIAKTISLLNDALGVLGSIDEVSETSEFESLKEAAEAIEFELLNA